MLLKVCALFVVVRLTQYGLIFLAPVSQFDTSTELLLKDLLVPQDLAASYWNIHLYNKLLAWDAVYFIKGMVSPGNNAHKYEHEYAFSNVWIQIVRWFIDDKRSTDVYYVLKTAIALENIFYFVSIIILYYLTVVTFSKNVISSNNLSYKVATKASMLFVLSSASGFLTGIYSEPVSFLFAFIGMLARELAIVSKTPYQLDVTWIYWPHYTIISSISFSVAVMNRSNCILLGIYYVFDLFQLLKMKNYGKAIFFPLLSGMLLFMAFFYTQYYIPFSIFCPERGDWCETQIIKSLPFTWQSFYPTIQSKYWNVGFLKYWTLNNIPNFLFALPNLIALSYSTIYFAKIYPCYNLIPLIWITRLLLIILFFFAHVQIINRISSFIPLHLWYLSDRLVKKSVINKKKYDNNESKGDDKIVKFYIYWLIIWIPLQTILFANFLPPA